MKARSSRPGTIPSVDEESLARLWASGETTLAEMAFELGVKQWQLQKTARRMGLGDKRAKLGRKFVVDPTPEEIEERCRQIREQHWTEEDYDLRWQYGRSHGWLPPGTENMGVRA